MDVNHVSHFETSSKNFGKLNSECHNKYRHDLHSIPSQYRINFLKNNIAKDDFSQFHGL